MVAAEGVVVEEKAEELESSPVSMDRGEAISVFARIRPKIEVCRAFGTAP